MSHTSERNRLIAMLLISALVLSCGALFQIWEQDIFWLIRDGHEIWKDLALPNGDRWSFSAPGGVWVNTYWLSALTFAGVDGIAGVNGLVYFRLLLVAFLLGTVGILAIQSSVSKSELKTSIFVPFVLLPFFYVAMVARIQLRPDFIIILFYALLNVVWFLDISFRRKAMLGFLLCFAAANFHQGASLALIGFFGFQVWVQSAKVTERIVWIVLGLATYFMTPNIAHTMAYIGTMSAVFDHASQNVLENPDFGPFRFDTSTSGYAVYVILLWAALAFVSLWFEWKRHATTRDRVLHCGFFLGLGFLGFYRERLMPFFLISTVPLLVRAAGATILNPTHQSLGSIPKVLAVVFGLGLLPLQWSHSSNHWGIGINDRVYPLGSVTFIRDTKPQGEIYHNPTYGNYLIYALPEYKVFIDTREVPYVEVHREMAKAFYSPLLTQDLFKKYQINAALMPQHQIVATSKDEFLDKVSEYYPPVQWALVHFDMISMVLVRRTTENQLLIQNHEYKYLKPHVPPGRVLDKIRQSPDQVAIFQNEAERCVKREPEQWICIAALAELAKLRGDVAMKEERMVQLLQIAEKRGFTPFIHYQMNRLQ